MVELGEDEEKFTAFIRPMTSEGGGEGGKEEEGGGGGGRGEDVRSSGTASLSACCPPVPRYIQTLQTPTLPSNIQCILSH